MVFLRFFAIIRESIHKNANSNTWRCSAGCANCQRRATGSTPYSAWEGKRLFGKLKKTHLRGRHVALRSTPELVNRNFTACCLLTGDALLDGIKLVRSSILTTSPLHTVRVIGHKRAA